MAAVRKNQGDHSKPKGKAWVRGMHLARAMRIEEHVRNNPNDALAKYRLHAELLFARFWQNSPFMPSRLSDWEHWD